MLAMTRQPIRGSAVPSLTLPANLPADIKAALQRLAAKWAAKKLDGKVTAREFVEFIGEGIDEAMEVVSPIIGGATKKELVLAFAGYLFDVFSPFILAKWGWLGWLLSFIGGQSVRDEFLQLVDFAIELYYSANFKPTS
jgi:hypothetical protein